MGTTEGFGGKGCAIAATVYEGLAEHFRREWMLWAFAEEAMAMIEEGKPDAAVLAVLWKTYAGEFEEGYRAENVFVHELPAVMIRKRADGERSGMVVLADGRIQFRHVACIGAIRVRAPAL